MKARMLVLVSLALGTASVALAQAPVQLNFSRVVDLTLPIESNMAPIPGLKPYLDNPSRVSVISSITEAQREALRAEGMTLSNDHAVNGRSMISVLSILGTQRYPHRCAAPHGREGTLGRSDARRAVRQGGRADQPARQGVQFSRDGEGRRGERRDAAIRMIALTGCRRSEILHLKWSEVDLANSCLRLGDTKTGASIRPLPKAAQAILKGIKPNSEHVFPGVTRSEKSYASVFPKAWRRIVDEAYTPHGLRHAYAGAAHELGLGELTIKALLGHARLGVTSGYITSVDSLLLDAAEMIANYINGAILGQRGKVISLYSEAESRVQGHA